MRARDLAKVASLLVHDGTWHGRRIVPEDWLSVSTTPHVQDFPWSSGGVYGYGYFWYPGTVKDGRSPIHGRTVIRASGFGNQGLFVVPDAGLAITVFAGNYEDNSRSVDTRLMGLIARALH